MHMTKPTGVSPVWTARNRADSAKCACAIETALEATKSLWSSFVSRSHIARTVLAVISRSVTMASSMSGLKQTQPLPPSGRRVSARRRHRLAERFKRFGADMVLDAFGVDARRLGADAERTQESFHRVVADAAFFRHLAPGIGQEHAAIGFSRHQP